MYSICKPPRSRSVASFRILSITQLNSSRDNTQPCLTRVFTWNSSTHCALALSYIVFAAAPTASQLLLTSAALPQSCHLLLTSHFEVYPQLSLLLPLSLLVHQLGSGPPSQPAHLLQQYSAQCLFSVPASLQPSEEVGWPHLVWCLLVSLCFRSADSSSRRSLPVGGASCPLPFPA